MSTYMSVHATEQNSPLSLNLAFDYVTTPESCYHVTCLWRRIDGGSCRVVDHSAAYVPLRWETEKRTKKRRDLIACRYHTQFHLICHLPGVQLVECGFTVTVRVRTVDSGYDVTVKLVLTI